MRAADFDIARNLKAIERLKADLIGSTASLLRGMYNNSEEEITEGLSDLLINTYLLARRLGIGHSRLDVKVEQRVRAMLNQRQDGDDLRGDLTSLHEYLQGNKG